MADEGGSHRIRSNGGICPVLAAGVVEQVKGGCLICQRRLGAPSRQSDREALLLEGGEEKEAVSYKWTANGKTVLLIPVFSLGVREWRSSSQRLIADEIISGAMKGIAARFQRQIHCAAGI